MTNIDALIAQLDRDAAAWSVFTNTITGPATAALEREAAAALSEQREEIERLERRLMAARNAAFSEGIARAKAEAECAQLRAVVAEADALRSRMADTLRNREFYGEYDRARAALAAPEGTEGAQT